VINFVDLGLFYSGRQFLEKGVYVHSRPPTSWAPNIPCPANSSHLIEPYSSHCAFASSCATINLSSTSSPMQMTNHPLIIFSILTNHTPPSSAPLPTSNPSCESEVSTVHFPKPLQSCTTMRFSPSHCIGPYSWP
jgi:hypothetical protein